MSHLTPARKSGGARRDDRGAGDRATLGPSIDDTRGSARAFARPFARAFTRAVTRVCARACALALAVALVPPLQAQHAGAEQGASAVMGEAMVEMPHLRLTPARAASAADSARARAIAAELRRAVAKYASVDAAVADGYEQFAPQLKQQRVLHFSKGRHAFRNEFGFDAARPTSLLYSRDAGGRMRLVGAMYTAPRRSTLAQLDGRVPLCISRWHLHTNVCVPKRRERERWTELRDGRMVFGLLSPIVTRAACDAVGGRFHDAVFNWMVHANFAADGSVTWGDDHAMHGGEGTPGTGAGHVH